MKISLTIPSVNQAPSHRPTACLYCGQPILHRHGSVSKPLKDHRLSLVIAHRYKCLSCKRTFRHYPSGVTRKTQSRRTVVLAALMYGLGRTIVLRWLSSARGAGSGSRPDERVA